MPNRRQLRNQSSLVIQQNVMHKYSIIVSRIYPIRIYTLEKMNIFCFAANNSVIYMCICFEDVFGAQCKEKIETTILLLLPNLALCPGVPNLPGPNLPRPDLPGPILPHQYCPGALFAGAGFAWVQFAAEPKTKSAGGLICLEPHNI